MSSTLLQGLHHPQFPLSFEAVLRDVRHLSARATSDLADWLVFLEVQGKADRTKYAYLRVVARLLVANPDVAFDEFTDAHIERFLMTVPRQSRHIARSIINQWFKWGKKKRRLDSNPMDMVADVKPPHHRPRDIFTPAEVAALEALPSPDGPLYTLLFGSGLRKAEARNCRLEHVDRDQNRLIILKGKGSKNAIIPLPLETVNAINDLALLEGINTGDYLWYSRPGRGTIVDRSHPIGDTTFSSWHDRCVAAAGVRYLSPHTTRHTYGHILRELGFHLEERQLLMRHDSSRTTQKYYGTLTVEDVATKMRALT
jgi:integrase